MAEPSDKTKKSVGRMSLGGIGKSLLGGAKKFAMWNLRHNTGNLFNKTSSSELVDKNHMPPAKVLGEIYKMMKIMDEDKKLNHEMVNSHLESEELKKDIRNKEIIKALTGRKKKKPVTPRKRKTKKEEEPTPPTGKGKEPEKGKEPDKVPNKSDDAKRNADAKKAEADRKAKEAKDAADAKKAENERAAQERESKRVKDEQEKAAARQKELEKEKADAKRAQDEADRKAAEAKTEAERKAADRAKEEANRKAAEAEKKAAEEAKARAKTEAERKAAEEEKKRLAEEEKKRLAEAEKKRLAEEAEKKRLAEEETAKRLKEEEARQTAKRLKDEEEAARKAQEAATAEKNKLPENKPSATPQAGPSVIPKNIPVPKGSEFLFSATKNAAFMSGLGVIATKYNTSVPDLLSFMMNESRMKPFAQNPTSKASGLIQIMPSTLKDMKEAKLASVKNIGTVDDIKKLSIEEQLPIIDDYLKFSGFEKSASIAKQQGRNVDLATLYSAIFLPAFKNKPNDFIMGIKPGQTVNGIKSTDTLYKQNGKDYTYGVVYSDNQGFDKSGKGYFNKGDIGIQASGFNKDVSQALSVNNTNNSGDQLNQNSVQNQDGKKELNGQQQNSPVGTNTTVINQQGVSPTKNTDSQDDTAEIFKKMFGTYN